jgi:PKD repeat protein
MQSIRSRPVRSIAARTFVAAGALVALMLAPVSSPTKAFADTSPAAGSNLPATVTNDVLPTVQINGVVWSAVTVGNTVYAAGNFTSARPAGNAPGVGEVTHNNLVAFNINTGVMTPWDASLNGAGRFITVSPDAATLYVGGDFTTANGQPRGHIAAYDLSTGGLKTNFAPSIDNSVRAIAVTNTAVYAGGSFAMVNSVPKSQIVSLSPHTGTINAGFVAASDGATVTAMTMSPDGTTLVVAGRFAKLNGAARYGAAGVEAVTGALTAWNSAWPIRDNTIDSSITALKTVGTHIFGAGYTTNFSGNFEGSFEIDKTGAIVWMNSCHGDTYDVGAFNGVLYTASHAHDCSDIGAWEEVTPRLWHRALASTSDAVASCTVAHNNNPPYTDFAGYKCAKLLAWDPDFAAGTFTGAAQGPWAVTGNSSYVVMGGEFPTVNGIAQYGLVRFAVPSIAAKKSGPIAAATLIPNVLSLAPGTARISWKSTWDRDNENLTYRLYRGSSNANLIYTVTSASRFWNMPNLGFTDTGQSTTALTKYHLTVTDPDGNQINIGTNSGTILDGSANPSNAYYQDVKADGANNYWRLNEASGTNAINSVSKNDMITGSGVTRATPGALVTSTDTASTFDGTGNGFASSQTLTQTPSVYSAELWFKTTSTSGGKLIGYGSANTGTSANNYDRSVYLDNSGHLIFGVTNTGASLTSSANSMAALVSPSTYNNGQWHQVVATLSAAGMVLYADGKQIAANPAVTSGMNFTGYWRIGGDNLTYWKNEPTSDFIAGSIDEVATYPTALTPAKVQKHYVDSGRTMPGNIAPVAAFTYIVNGGGVAFNGSTSTDADGTITGYNWNFGDGTTGTGVSPTHVYALAGTRTVTLTITDTGGSSNSIAKSVTTTVNGIVTLASDDFNRNAASSWGNADTGGVWTVSSAPSFAVTAGAGRMTLSAAGTSRNAYLNSVAWSNTNARVTVSLDKVATGGGTYITLAARKVANQGEYRAKVVIAANGAVTIQLVRSNSVGVETLIGAPVPVAGLVYTAGLALQVRMQVTGIGTTSLNAKVWNNAGAEPASWQVSATDTTAGLQAAGAVGVIGYLSGSTTNAPTTLSFDALWVTTT